MVMPKKPGNQLINPGQFRAMATGIGQTQQRSKMTGERRAEKVVECMPPGVPSMAVGYPRRDPVTAMYTYADPDAPLPVDGTVKAGF